MVETAFHHALGGRAAVALQDFAFQRAGIHADAHRHIVGAQAVRQSTHVVFPADVAGIDAHLGDAIFHSLDGKPVVEVYVRYQRHWAGVHEGAHIPRAGFVVDGHAHNLRARVCEGANLGNGSPGVAGVGIGHGLHRYPSTAPNLYISCVYSLCKHIPTP